MSLADDAKLLLIPTGYKASKVYSVFPTDGDGDFDYTRSGDASRVNPGGLIETVGTNIPRIDHFGGGCPTLLLEPQRTNLLKYSEDYSQSQWSKNNSTIDTNSIISPNGTLTANKFIEDNTTNTHRLNQILFSASNDTYTFSVFAKKNGRSDFHLSISDSATGQANILVDLDNGTFTNGVKPTGSWTNVSGGIENYGNGWYRVHVTGDKNAGTNIIADLELYNNARNYTGDGISGIYVWGAMLEQASYPTSYIKTEAIAVTRLVDSCEVASGLENIINQKEGVFYIEFEYLYETTTDSSTDANRDLLIIGSTTNFTDYISIDNYRSQFRVFIFQSGIPQQSIGSNTTGSSQPNTRYKLAVNYKSGDNKAYLNGSLLGTVQTGNISFANDLDGIFFSYNNASRSFKNQKKVYDLRVYDTALTDNELIELTTL